MKRPDAARTASVRVPQPSNCLRGDRLDVELDLVAVGVLQAEARRGALRLAERRQPVARHLVARGQERLAASPDAERDVVETGRALDRRARLGARDFEGEVVMMEAGGEKGNASTLAASGLREAEQIAIEAHGGLEV